MNVVKKGFFYSSLAAVVALSGLISGCGSDSVVAPAATAATPAAVAAAPATTATLLYTSDAHFGIKRASGVAAGTYNYTFSAYSGARALGETAFGGYSSAWQVNRAMAYVMKGMPVKTLPNDGGVSAGSAIGSVSYVIQGGDIANRMQSDTKNGIGANYVQSAYASWGQFVNYFSNVHGFPSLLIPGNHDVSNAIGYTKVMSRDGGSSTVPVNTLTNLDGSVMAFIYDNFISNKFNSSSLAKTAVQDSYTNGTYQDAANKIYYSRDIAGVHFMFIGMWPDTDAQAWMDTDLARISSTTPAIIVTHDEPTTEAKHLTDPVLGPKVFNTTNKFENILVNTAAYLTVTAAETADATQNIYSYSTYGAQRTLVRFLQKHKNIVAYFHGNTNYNEFYYYTGPDNNISIPVFRVDSPMKGVYSGQDSALKDPTAGTTNPFDGLPVPNGALPKGWAYKTDDLSFQVISLDSVAKKMTVREFLWKINKWGANRTIDLTPRAL
jgi:hypothetical protein